MKHGFSGEGQKKRQPDTALVGRVRAALILRGTTLAQWADQRGVARGNLHNAISGRRTGKRSLALRAELLAEVGLAQRGAEDQAGLGRVRAHVREVRPLHGGRQ